MLFNALWKLQHLQFKQKKNKPYYAYEWLLDYLFRKTNSYNTAHYNIKSTGLYKYIYNNNII